MDKQIRQRVVGMFNNVDGQLAVQSAQGIGANPPANPGGTGVTTSSPTVSQENTPKTARTRKVAILLENGYNFPEVNQVMEALKNAGVHMEIISKNLGMVTSVDGQQLEVNKNYLSAGSINYDAVYVAGGRQNVDTLINQGDSVHFINEAFRHAKAIGATNEGVDLLATSQIQVVKLADPQTYAQLFSEMGVVTIRNAADMGNADQESYFSHEFIKAIAQHRHWIRQGQKEMIPA